MDPQMMQQMSAFGALQKLSTGNMVIDMAVCLLVPFLLTHFKPYVDRLWAWLNQTNDDARFNRHIKFKKREGYYHYDPNERNNILQEAVLLYIGSRQDLVEKFKTADVKLYPIDRYKESYGEESECSESEDEGACNMARELKALKVNTQPASNERFEVEPGVFFTKVETVEDRGNDGSRRDEEINFTITCNLKDGNDRIQAFIDKAFDYYVHLQSGKKDKARYLFMPTKAVKENEEGVAQNNMVYKRYKLSDEKTFDCFFHEEKPALLTLVDHFVRKTGKFQILGYPKKLGLLLHGPPGTGKTSLIKALAHYTKRSIVSVPLTKVKTNQELMDIMFDSAFLVQGEELPMRLTNSKVIFVMEDVDAAGSVVLRRDKDEGPWSMKGEKRGKSEPGEDAKSMLDLGAYARMVGTGNSHSQGNGKKDGGSDKTNNKAFGPELLKGSLWNDTSDDLNLAGVLNVLDGVVDCPDRIVILTTNHPDLLDPALIRPGRVNKKIYLGYMTARQARNMAKHYFESASEEVLDAFQEVVPSEALTPAKLEAMCAEHDELSSLVAKLRAGFQNSGL